MMNPVLQKLKAPGSGLIISGILNGTFGLIALISGIIRFSGISGKEDLPTDRGELIGYLISTFGGYGIALLSIIAAPIIIFGGVRLLKGQSKGLVIFAAILTILPLTSCCFVVSAIFGLWTLIILRNPDVKMFFQNGGEQINLSQPPQNW